MPPFDPSALINLFGFAAIVAAGVVYLRSTLVKQRNEELANLAETRGHRISDQDEKIRRLEESVAELRGQVLAMQALKATEIADEVFARLDAANFGQ